MCIRDSPPPNCLSFEPIWVFWNPLGLAWCSANRFDQISFIQSMLLTSSADRCLQWPDWQPQHNWSWRQLQSPRRHRRGLRLWYKWRGSDQRGCSRDCTPSGTRSRAQTSWTHTCNRYLRRYKICTKWLLMYRSVTRRLTFQKLSYHSYFIPSCTVMSAH